MPRIEINQDWFDDCHPNFRYRELEIAVLNRDSSLQPIGEVETLFWQLRDRMSLLHLQSLYPHSRTDPVIVVVDRSTLLGRLDFDIARGMELRIEEG